MNRVVCTKFQSIYLSLLRNSNNLIKVCTKFNIHSINNINILKGHSKSMMKIFNQGVSEKDPMAAGREVNGSGV